MFHLIYRSWAESFRLCCSVDGSWKRLAYAGLGEGTHQCSGVWLFVVFKWGCWRTWVLKLIPEMQSLATIKEHSQEQCLY